MEDNYLGQTFEFKAIPVAEKYYSEDTVWGCFVFSTDTDLPKTKQYNHYDFETNTTSEIYQGTLIGKMQRLSIGQEYDVKAKLEYSTKYKTYNYTTISIGQDVPQTIDDQRKFLMSVCTQNQVESLLGAYPNIVQEVISGTENVDLSKTKYIKEHTWNLIRDRILENYIIADILTMLIPLGVSYAKVKKLLNGEPNPHILKQRLLDDTYVLTDIPGLGFKSVDKIALKLNPDLLISKKRTIAFLKHFLQEVGESEGHTWVKFDVLEIAVKENVIECEEMFKVTIEEQKEFATFLHIEDDKIGLKYLFEIENKIFEILNQVNKSDPLQLTQEEIEDGIRKSEQDQGFVFTEQQRDVLINITKTNVNFLAGVAGTGKSSISRGILNIYKNYSIGCAALSAKAAKRLMETTGFQAQTLHKMLGATGPNKFEYNEKNPLSYNLVLIDESSMLNAFLIWSLLKAVKPDTKIVMVGDHKQLPPLGAGNVFSDLLEKENEFQVNKLTKILRQAELSGIITDAGMVRNGINPVEKKSFKTVHGELEDLYYMFRSSRDELNDIAIKTFLKTVENIGLDNVIILTPRKKECVNSTREINQKIQNALIGDVPYMEYGKTKYKIGSKVIHIKNDYEKGVMNGEIGYVNRLDYNENGEQVLIVTYEDKEIAYEKDDLSDIDLAYALTTHRFQGSQCDTVISILDKTHFMLLGREYLYTTMTRSVKRCLILAEPWAFDKAVETEKGASRNTWLKYM
jgi:exodeoxyribonuclease V alpha subunit